MHGVISAIPSLARPYPSDLENIGTYRRYLEKCSKSTYYQVFTTSERLLRLSDKELQRFLAESRQLGHRYKVLQENMYSLPYSVFEKFELPHFGFDEYRPYSSDLKNMDSYRKYLEQLAKKDVRSVSHYARCMLEQTDEVLRPFYIQACKMITI